jgi:molybdopterin/thiamine biosynthesis adenylyltransferase
MNSLYNPEQARLLDRISSAASVRPVVVIPYGADAAIDPVAVSNVEKLHARATIFVDLFDALLRELMLTVHPQYKREPELIDARFVEFRSNYLGGRPAELAGSFVLYPNGRLIRLLFPDDHYKLRTSRNLGLFTPEEQMRLHDARIAVAGLSVGSAAALTLAMEGINTFFLADFDKLSCSNLNRLASSLSQIDVEKTKIAAQRIWDIDPFATIVTDDEGFTAKSNSKLFTAIGKPDVVIDAIDSLEAKYALRAACREHRVPIVAMLDIGDGLVQVDTERYDLDPSYPAFHGLINASEEASFEERVFKFLNRDYLPFRFAESFSLALQHEYAGFSQLAGTVSLAAGVTARIVRRILLGEPVNPRVIINVDEKADPDYAKNRKADRAKTDDYIASLSAK